MSTRVQTTRSLLSILLAIFLLGAVGCGDDSNPTAPTGDPTPDPEPEIRTPVLLKVSSIRVDAFNEKKGSFTWDVSLRVAPRRPDVYVQLQLDSASSSPIFISTVKEDAFSGTFLQMSEAAVGADLPRTVSAGIKLIVSLYDDDGIIGDDFMGSVSFKPIDLYKDDNAPGFSHSFAGSGGTEFWIRGTWVY